MTYVMKAVVVFLLVGLVTQTSAVETNPLCPALTVNLNPCLAILQTRILPHPPPAACCDGLKGIKKALDMYGLEKVKACFINPISVGAPIPPAVVGVDISAEIQAACVVDLGFSISVDA